MGSSRATALALIVATTTAQAQPKPSQAQIQQAGDLVKKAIAKSQAGDHTLAIELYQQAYNVIPTPILLSNIGSEYQQAQKPAEAVTYFCKYLTAEPVGSGAQFATTQVKSLQIELGKDVDDSDVCHPKAKPVAAPPPVTEPPVTGGNFGPTGGPGNESSSHPGRTLEISGVVVAVVGAAALGLGIHYALEGRALNNDIRDHDPNTAWPLTYEGVPIQNWDAQGHTWNVDAAVWSAIGGAVLVGGVVMIGLGASTHGATEHEARLIPTGGMHDAGLAVVGRF
jgi:tetratricopeptide (TPR) repeat protein